MEDPTVVLLTVGEDSGVLREEIEKKGLHVVSCAFSEAEETVEEHDPLLIVLHGARGAVELSTLLEDSAAAHPQKVAVVAPRKDLAQLMGLNREIVIGLVALEMTEKTAAARVEALVRQTAKQRGVQINLAARRMSMGPRLSVGTQPAAEVAKQPMVLEAPTPGLGKDPGRLGRGEDGGSRGKTRDGKALGGRAANGEAPAPPDLELAERKGSPEKPRRASNMMAEPGEIPGAPRMPGETAIGLPQAPRKKSPRSTSQIEGGADGSPPGGRDDDDSPPPLTSAPPEKMGAESLSPSILESVPAEVTRGPGASSTDGPPLGRPKHLKKTLVGVPGPPGGAPAQQTPDDLPTVGERAGTEEPGLNLDDIDSLVPESLRPSEMVSDAPDEGDAAAEVPRADPLPNFDPSELLSDSSDDGLSLVDPPGVEPGDDEAAKETPRAQPEEERGGADLAGASEEEPVAPGDGGARSRVSDSMPFGATIAEPRLSPVAAADEQHPDAHQLEEEEPPLPPEATLPPPATEQDFEGDEEPPVRAMPAAAEEPADVKKSGGGGLLAAALVLLAGGAAGVYYFAQNPGIAGPSADVAPSRAQQASSSAPSATVEEEAEAPLHGEEEPASADAGTPSAQDDSDAAADGDATTADGDAVADGDDTAADDDDSQAADGDQPATATGRSADSKPASVESFVTLVDNPFKTPDKNLPGCSELAPDVKAETNDPVTEASTHWAAARKLIVKGDIKGASQAMCMAVGINADSPANEGLARLYALAYSPAQAMIWVEKALELAPEDRDLISLRGDIQSQLGDQDAATKEWLRALSLDPDEESRRKSQAREYALLARKLRSQGDLPKAEQFYRRALGLSPRDITALSGIADVLLARELYDHAGTFAVRALEVFEAMPETHLVLGDVAMAREQPQAARASYERALAIRPDFWPAKKRISDLNKKK